jgi:hypothetical protein
MAPQTEIPVVWMSPSITTMFLFTLTIS